MTESQTEDIRRAVRERYGAVAAGQSGCCGPAAETASPCCAPAPGAKHATARKMGYGEADFAAAPDEAIMGLGCGNPTAIAALRPGETVLDLGSGGGFDCFLAAQEVGSEGRVIGVDMTPEMVERARRNAAKMESRNVEFRLGEIEHLPVADGSVEVILSNCVINLSPDKPAAFEEAFRVLRPGGRLCVSDIVATAPLPEALKGDEDLVCGCIGGAATVEDLTAWIEAAGFAELRIEIKGESRDLVSGWAPGRGVEDWVASATITARKPPR